MADAPRRSWPGLRSILLAVNLVVLLLPVGGLLGLRLYENELLRQTEAELLAQAAFVIAAYRSQVLEDRGALPLPAPIMVEPDDDPGPLDPRPARLDRLTDRVWPQGAVATAPPHPPDPEAARVGARLEPMLRAVNRMTLAGIRVVDRAGIVVASSGAEKGLSLAARTEVRRALEGQDVRLLRERVSDEPAPPMASLSRGTPVRIFVAEPIEARGEILGAVVLSRTPLTVTKALYQQRWALLAGALALVLAVVVVSALTSLAIARPMRALVGRARRLARGDAAALAPLANPGTRELAELSDAFTYMATTLAHRAEYIQAFAANVSHEFKTPLASMRGTVELLQDHLGQMDEAERARFLGMLEADVARLDRLVRALLELARADVARPTDATCDAQAVARGCAARMAERGLAVTLPEGGLPAPARISAETLDSILTNLLDNARRHGGAGAQVRMRVAADAQPPPEGSILIEVEDDGPGVSPANADKVFTAFFTTAREAGGTGLGLAVARTLARGHGGDLTLEPSAKGARFRLRVPRGR